MNSRLCKGILVLNFLLITCLRINPRAIGQIFPQRPAAGAGVHTTGPGRLAPTPGVLRRLCLAAPLLRIPVYLCAFPPGLTAQGSEPRGACRSVSSLTDGGPLAPHLTLPLESPSHYRSVCCVPESEGWGLWAAGQEPCRLWAPGTSWGGGGEGSPGLPGLGRPDTLARAGAASQLALLGLGHCTGLAGSDPAWPVLGRPSRLPGGAGQGDGLTTAEERAWELGLQVWQVGTGRSWLEATAGLAEVLGVPVPLEALQGPEGAPRPALKGCRREMS